jgi:hypothetical protein
MKPVALVTGEVSPYRRGPFRMLAEVEGLEVLAWASTGEPVPGLTVHATTQAGAARAVASKCIWQAAQRDLCSRTRSTAAASAVPRASASFAS